MTTPSPAPRVGSTLPDRLRRPARPIPPADLSEFPPHPRTLTRVSDPVFRAELENWLQHGVRAWFGPRILEVDEAVLLTLRRLVTEGQKARYTYAQPDALIAATAKVHGLAVVTRNVEDFVQAGVPILNPWAPV
jgi:predicted nucleic acid-binding protein